MCGAQTVVKAISAFHVPVNVCTHMYVGLVIVCNREIIEAVGAFDIHNIYYNVACLLGVC